MRNDHDSRSWLVWCTQDLKLVKSAHVTFENEDRVFDLVGEVQEVNLGQDPESTMADGLGTEQEHNRTEGDVKGEISKREEKRLASIPSFRATSAP